MLISDQIFSLFQRQDTVASLLAQSPESTLNSLCSKHFDSNGHGGTHDHQFVVGDTPLTAEDLERSSRCGKFDKRPSDLFLSMYTEVLRTLKHDQLVNLVAPPIMASTGVIPLSIISVIPDIMRHYADLIVTAETEVFLATNYWEASTAQKIITDALVELSRRAGARGTKVVVKLMYDRGNIKQLLEPHQIVKEEVYTASAVKLPKASDIPNVNLEVCNYHHPVLGTFHAKYMVVDRKIAVINSNNVQDRVNMEMMAHLEGPIVEAFYDMCLVSWGAALTPPLPCLLSPPHNHGGHYRFQSDHEHIKVKDLQSAKEDATTSLITSEYPSDMNTGRKQGVTIDTATDVTDGKALSFEEKLASVTKRLNTTIQPDTKATLLALDADGVDFTDFNPHIIHAPHEPFPIAMVNRKPRGSMNYTDIDNPQDVSWLAGFHYAKKSVFIQTPTFTAPPVIAAALAAARRGIVVTIFADVGFNDSGEALPKQGGTNEVNAIRMFKELEPEFKKNLNYFWYTGKDMNKPINANMKKRNCHVKIMIVDDQVGIQGNGNQDGQSWYHSQEANIMIDSKEVCAEWMTGILSNQNTHLYGRVDEDGIWRDPKTRSELPDMGGKKSGPSAIISGLAGTLRRVQGKGGFGT